MSDRTDTIDEAACMDGRQAVAAGLGLAAVAVLAGCGGGGGGGGDDAGTAESINTITGLTIAEASAASITVDGVAGSGSGVAFALNGGSGAASRPADPGLAGTARNYSFVATGAGGTTNLGVTINPAPSTLATAHYSALSSRAATVGAMAFPPSWDELVSYANLSHAQLVDRLLGRMTGQPMEAYPSWIDSEILSSVQYNALSSDAKNAYNNSKGTRRKEFKFWFFRQMVTSSDPLSERLLLFWHNLWTSNANDLDDPQLIARQHRLYRQHLGGNFRTWLKAMTRDPGMCLYLDSARNKRGSPNENFARELMELFTLGERTEFGAYDEADIPMVARCFTGYGLDANRGFVLNASDHDYGPTNGLSHKTLWGVDLPDDSGDGDAVIDLILARTVGGHNACGRYIVTRLWREFVGEIQAGDAATIAALGDQFAGPFAWDLTQLYRALFTTAVFADGSRRGTRIRSPVEMYVAYYRSLSVRPDDWYEDEWTLYSLDQDLLCPPNVFGWKGGTAWVTVKTLVDRRTFMDWLGWGYRQRVPERLLNVLDILLMAANPVVAPSTTSGTDAAGQRARQYITDSAFNLR